MLLRYAFAHDWLYNELSDANRTTIQNTLIQRTRESYEAAMNLHNVNGDNWWRNSYMHNHWSNNIGALGVASLVLEEEHPEATTWLNYAIDMYKKDSYILSQIREGSWHESIRYQAFKFQKSLPFYYNLERIKGINLIPEEYFQNYIYWKLYNHLPGTARYAINFADIYPNNWFDYAQHSILRFMANRYDNGHAEWLAQKILSLSGSRSDYWRPYYVYEFFYYNPSIQLDPPDDLPLDKTFDDLGIVTWRTGWGDDDLVFGLKSSAYGGKFNTNSYVNNQYPFDASDARAHVGHDHPDANTFYLYKGSVDLASEKDRYQVFVTDNHNTILVDQQEQFRLDWQIWPSIRNNLDNIDGKIKAVYTTPDFNYLSADATNLYREKIDNVTPGASVINEFTRHVIFAKPNYLIMVDNLRSDTTHRYDWIYHVSESGSISVENDWIKGDANGNDILGINVLSPNGFLYDLGSSSGKPYIRIRPQTNVADTRFVNVLFPTTSAEWNNKPATSLLGKTDQGAGIRVYLDGTQDHVIKYGSANEISIDEYRLKGNMASVVKDSSSNLQKIFLVNGTGLSDTNGNRELAQSLNNKTFEAVFSGSTLSLYGNNLQGLKIYAPDVNSSEVTVNGEYVIISISGNYITIDSNNPVPDYESPMPPSNLRIIN
jgi:hypothetical protein